MWVDNLPSNLEYLSLLSVSSVSVSNVAIEPPLVLDRVILPVDLPLDEAAGYRRDINRVRRERAKGSPASSTRGGKKRAISREDVLISIEGLSDLANFFVLGFTGLLQSGSTEEFTRIVYTEGLKQGNSFKLVTFDDFEGVFRCACYDLMNPCHGGKPRKDIGTQSGLARSMGCSKDKAKRLLESYQDTAHILMVSAQEVSQKLYHGLKKAA